MIGLHRASFPSNLNAPFLSKDDFARELKQSVDGEAPVSSPTRTERNAYPAGD